MEQKKICPFYLKGNCKFGDKCKNYHPPNQSVAKQVPNINHSQNSNHNNCKFFLTNSCNKNDNCHFFHGFGDSLMHIKTIENACDNEIINLVKMDDTKYIVSDEKSFIVRFTQNDYNFRPVKVKASKIGKLIFGNNKVIFSLVREE
jgi:hypothetical protein